MIRTQIQLEAEQHRALKRWAASRGISMAEAVRRCVAAELAREEGGGRPAMVREALGVVGRYADPDGCTTVATDHDDLLDDAYRR